MTVRQTANMSPRALSASRELRRRAAQGGALNLLGGLYFGRSRQSNHRVTAPVFSDPRRLADHTTVIQLKRDISLIVVARRSERARATACSEPSAVCRSELRGRLQRARRRQQQAPKASWLTMLSHRLLYSATEHCTRIGPTQRAGAAADGCGRMSLAMVVEPQPQRQHVSEKTVLKLGMK